MEILQILCICYTDLVCWFWIVFITLIQISPLSAEWMNLIQELNILIQILYTKIFLKLIINCGWSRRKGYIARIASSHTSFFFFFFWLMIVGSYTAAKHRNQEGTITVENGARWVLSKCDGCWFETLHFCSHDASKPQDHQHFLKSCEPTWFLLSLHYSEASARTQLLRGR